MADDTNEEAEADLADEVRGWGPDRSRALQRLIARPPAARMSCWRPTACLRHRAPASRALRPASPARTAPAGAGSARLCGRPGPAQPGRSCLAPTHPGSSLPQPRGARGRCREGRAEEVVVRQRASRGPACIAPRPRSRRRPAAARSRRSAPREMPSAVRAAPSSASRPSGPARRACSWTRTWWTRRRACFVARGSNARHPQQGLVSARVSALRASLTLASHTPRRAPTRSPAGARRRPPPFGRRRKGTRSPSRCCGWRPPSRSAADTCAGSATAGR